MKHPKIAALITAYRDKDAVLTCVKALQSQSHPLDLIIIVDNSERSIFNGESFLDDKIVVIKPGFNMGVAGALNEGFRHCIKNGIDWCWTFDQDSEPYPNALEELLKYLPEAVRRYNDKVGILASTGISRAHNTLYWGNRAKWLYNNSKISRRAVFYECDLVLTAGSLTNTKYIERFGGPNPDLFIDWVDFDLCLKMKRDGYHIFSCSTSFYMHQIGQKPRYAANSEESDKFAFKRSYCLVRNAAFTLLHTCKGFRTKAYFLYFMISKYMEIVKQERGLSAGMFFRAIHDGAAKKLGDIADAR